MNNIRAINENEVGKLHSVIRRSFQTIADDLKLTQTTAPTNPAFISMEAFHLSIDQGLRMYGYYQDNEIIGCVGIKQSDNDGLFYIERLAVLPEHRHMGVGKELVRYALKVIMSNGGQKVSIGIINQNSILKDWYSAMGFIETQIKKYDHLPFDVCFMEKMVQV